MWRPRDHERYIGRYDPEHEMPDPDRGPGDRWQSDAYRHGARDTRFAYRWNPDRVEQRFGERHPYDYERTGYGYERDYSSDYDRGFRSGFERGLEDARYRSAPRRGGAYYEGEMGPGRFDNRFEDYDRDSWRRRR